MYQQQNYYQPQQMQMPIRQTIGLKGRPVSSLEEVRATAVDFDGSIFYFPNLANDTIYTKQINLDGTSSIRVYELAQTPVAASALPNSNLVTKDEFDETVKNLADQITGLQELIAQPSVKPQTQEFNF